MPGQIVLFGSGEMSPTGRKIHEQVFKQNGFVAPTKIGILETPTGFEVNALHAWPERMEQFFSQGLKNYKPNITRIRAWKKDGELSTNNAIIVDPILQQDYVYCGAGSPTYTVKHLEDSLAYKHMMALHKDGGVLCLGSATAIAVGQYTLPVYEIFKAGADLYWEKGLNFFQPYDLNVTIIPHWNNQEGEDFDTTHCWMGIERFGILQSMIRKDSILLGIDEQTACVFDVVKKTIEVMGIGQAHIIKNGKEKHIASGKTFGFEELQ